MSPRPTPLVTGNYYHIFTRGVDKRITFEDQNDYQRFFETIVYYTFTPPLKISEYLRLSPPLRQMTREKIIHSPTQITITTYCFMTNHFHLLIRQEKDNGISQYCKNLIGSYTRYFNIKHKRTGHLFESQFKSVLIESDEELLHVSRYIHLNPHTSGLVSTFEQCATYPWSSFKYYLGSPPSFLHTEEILDQFKDKGAGYKAFVENQKDYQRTLAALKDSHQEI